MSLPQPPTALQDPCTIIYNNKLYSYQANAFQSLDLQDGGKWSQLPMGLSATGATCLQGSVDDKPAFLVIGGTSSAPDYKGLQHFDLTSNQWRNDTPADGVAQNRQHHGTAFLQQSSEIVMYAGSQDGSQTPSTQTFLISTTSPYTVLALESKGAPPVEDPLMLPYNASHALMLGGDSTNAKLYLFSPAGGWQQMHVSLPSTLKDSSKMQATLLTGGDGSKLLEIFDLSVSPNQISNVLLHNATVSSSTHSSKARRSRFAQQHHPTRKRKRQTTLASRPAYNSSGAPQDTRSGFSLSSDSETGLVVAAGGNSQQPLVMFNQTSNQWIDPHDLLGVQPSSTSSSTLASPTSTGIPASSPTTPAETSAAAVANNDAKHRSLRVLGGVLGGVFGAAVLFVLIVLLSRFCRKRRDREYRRRKSEYTLDTTNDPMDFTDIGADFMKEAGGSVTALPATNHLRKQSDRSVDPRTIDRGMTASSESKRALLHTKGDSAGSGHSFWSRETRSPEMANKSPPPVSAPVMGAPAGRSLMVPEPRAETGWSRYFANNSSQEVIPSMPLSHTPSNRPDTYLSGTTRPSQTDDDIYGISTSRPHESAEVAPLSFSQMAPTSRAPAGPSSAAHAPALGLALTHGPSPERDREIEPATPSTLVSNLSDDDESDLHLRFSHVIGEDSSAGHDSWSPVHTAGQRGSAWTDDRPVSTMTPGHKSLIGPPGGERVVIPNFPMPSTSAAPSPNLRSPANERADAFDFDHPHPQTDRGLRNIVSSDIARSQSGRQTATPDIRTGTQRVLPGTGAGEVRTFPRPREELGPRGRGGPETEDMSWLNLGTTTEQRPQPGKSGNHGFYGHGW